MRHSSLWPAYHAANRHPVEQYRAWLQYGQDTTCGSSGELRTFPPSHDLSSRQWWHTEYLWSFSTQNTMGLVMKMSRSPSISRKAKSPDPSMMDGRIANGIVARTVRNIFWQRSWSRWNGLRWEVE